MRPTAEPLPLPAGRPSPYLPLVDEPVFEPGRHLALEAPTHITSLEELGVPTGADGRLQFCLRLQQRLPHPV